MAKSQQPKAPLLDRIGAWIARKPEDRDELTEVLRASHQRALIDADALAMIEGVLQVSEMQVRDIMVPRSRMDVIDIRESPDQFIPVVMQTGHASMITSVGTAAFTVAERGASDISAISPM